MPKNQYIYISIFQLNSKLKTKDKLISIVYLLNIKKYKLNHPNKVIFERKQFITKAKQQLLTYWLKRFL